MRSRINERLERAARFPVTLIVAPAGFGKSSALRDFIESSRLDALRYDVRREDNTLLEFVHRLSEALASVAPSAIASFPAMQERVLASAEPVRQLSDWFVEHLKRTVCTVVLDDLHYAATDPASIALLADLIERTSERIKWIVAARSDVGLPIASWIAYGRMDVPLGEEELRFTAEEALAAAGDTIADLDPQEVESLRQLTEGWPVALTIALRTRTHSRDLRTASFSTRDMIYRYLAEQVFAALSPAQRSFALSTSVFPAFDLPIAEQLGASAEFLSELRAKIAFLNEVAPREYRYHDLFRDFLETELRRSGERVWNQGVCRAARVLEERGDYAGALALYTKAASAGDVLRIVASHGFSLFERGETERLAAALDSVSDAGIATNAAAMGLKAMIEAGRGRFPLVEKRFEMAIGAAAADRELQIALVHRYAIELVRHERNAVAFLEPYALQKDLSDAQRVQLLGTLSTAYVRAGRYDNAVSTIERAVSLLDPSMSPEMQARLYQQAAFVYHTGPETQRTRSYAKAAISLALKNNLHEVAARAYTALYHIAHNYDDDPIAALSALDKTEENALKAASNQAHTFALIAAYEIEADRGDELALERLDASLHENESALPQTRSEALLPANALRIAWTGQFDRAMRLLQPTLEGESFSSPDREALRASEVALYATAAGDMESGAAAARIAVRALEQSKAPNRRTVRARGFLALAELVQGHESAAHRHLSEAESSAAASSRRLRALLQALRILYRVHLGQSDSEALAGALERLRAEHFGGLARLLQALPAGGPGGQAYGTLTPAEREILQLLARGASTKDVAGATGRSPHTVDTHIRSICRKLECSGRREAVALATSRGWVQT
jgi:LuxR family maltose regulon positive regulatory protein